MPIVCAANCPIKCALDILNTHTHSNQASHELRTMSAHERSQRQLAQKFSLRPTTTTTPPAPVEPGDLHSGSNESTETSQLQYIARCLSVHVPNAGAADEPLRIDLLGTSASASASSLSPSVSGSVWNESAAAGRRLNATAGDGSAEAFYFAADRLAGIFDGSAPPPTQAQKRPFQIDSRVELAADAIAAAAAAANVGPSGDEAIELAQLHERFMLHDQQSTDDMMLAAEQFPGNCGPTVSHGVECGDDVLSCACWTQTRCRCSRFSAAMPIDRTARLRSTA